MKLLTKTTLIYLLITVSLFGAGGYYFYLGLEDLVREEAEEHLEVEMQRLQNYVKEHDTFPVIQMTLGDKLLIEPRRLSMKEGIMDTVIYDPDAEEKIPYLQMTSFIDVNGFSYAVVIRKALLESDDLTDGIIDIVVPMAITLVIILLVLNYLVSKAAWKPFFYNVSKIRAYNLSGRTRLELRESRTAEFRQLNEAVKAMTDKIESDYNSLKTFTENASHEIQTPLAIIKAKAETLMQSPGLEKDEAEEVQTIFSTVLRLSRLNQTLLLMAKIGNDQFMTDQTTDLAKILGERLELYEDMIRHRDLRLTVHAPSPAEKVIHPVLAEILVSNLLQNAIRHGRSGGEMTVSLTENEFCVCNSGEELTVPAEKLFERFYRGGTGPESTGLGLALVKEIALKCGWDVRYSRKDGLHCFCVRFSRIGTES